MKTPNRHTFPTMPLLSAMASLLVAATSQAQTVYFDADFNGATVTEVKAGVYLAEINKTNLDAGTAVGDWTINQAQSPVGTNRAYRTIQGEGAANVTNKALRFGIGLNGTLGIGNPVITANLASTVAVSNTAPITVAFDYADGTNDGGGGGRPFYLTGVDGSDRRLFQLAFYTTGGVHRLGYVTGSGTTLIGANNDVNYTSSSDGAAGDYDPSKMKTIELVIDGDSFDVLLNGVILAGADDIAFRDASADGLAKLKFSTSTTWTAGWFDNLSVTAASAPSTGFQLIITPNGANYDFSWDSQAGKVYDLVSSTDLSTPILGWPVYDDGVNPIYENMAPSGSGINTLTAVIPSGTPRFFAVVEKDLPPLFTEDFEAGDGGFTATGTPNDWAWGAPDSNNNATPSLVLTTGNGGSTNCWGTNLGDGSVPGSGFIDTAADSILRSPNIDLTGISGAQLAFAAAVDAASGDTIAVLVREVGTDALLDTINPVTTLPATATWADFGPFDLSAADNKDIYLEFRFQGTDDTYIGFYIDDVAVTGTVP